MGKIAIAKAETNLGPSAALEVTYLYALQYLQLDAVITRWLADDTDTGNPCTSLPEGKTAPLAQPCVEQHYSNGTYHPAHLGHGTLHRCLL